MCSEFKIKTTEKQIVKVLGESFKNITKNDSWDLRVKMSVKAPVLGIKNGQIALNKLLFPVRPFPNARLSQTESNKKKLKISALEEQIVRIYEVPLWKESFEKFPCIIPMTSFLEPAYWGPNAGKVVEFEDPKEELLFAAGILIKPFTPATGKLDAFSILTHTASEQMLQSHHRLIELLRADSALEYLRLGNVPPQVRFNFLIANRYVPIFKTSIDRTMASTWKSRVLKHEGDLLAETKYLETLKREDVSG